VERFATEEAAVQRLGELQKREDQRRQRREVLNRTLPPSWRPMLVNWIKA
jgi:hypothetical protein